MTSWKASTLATDPPSHFSLQLGALMLQLLSSFAQTLFDAITRHVRNFECVLENGANEIDTGTRKLSANRLSSCSSTQGRACAKRLFFSVR